MESIDLSDRAVIEAQIGRTPRGLVDVSVRCSYGYPQVIRVRPLIKRQPFPTLYWLTCPYLAKRIDRLEAAGWIGRLEQQMAEDGTLRDAMERAHERYIAGRSAMLTDDDRAVVAALGLTSSLMDRGIGGIADRSRLKCLHLHVAHELAETNSVGERVLSMLGVIECAKEKVICSALL